MFKNKEIRHMRSLKPDVLQTVAVSACIYYGNNHTTLNYKTRLSRLDAVVLI